MVALVFVIPEIEKDFNFFFYSFDVRVHFGKHNH